MIWVDRIVGAVGIIALSAAAVLWLRAAIINIPDNQDTFIAALQHAARWNSYASFAAVGAALCGVWTYVRSIS